MVLRPAQPLPRPLRALAAALALAVVAALPAAARADCPGAGATCPYTAASQVGQRAEGVMRFPQALAIGPDGSVFVADQGSHVVQVFGPDGVFRREFGIAGSKPGQLSGVGAIAVAGDGSVLVADGANRIDRFDANGQLMNSWGGTGSDVGKFRFGAGAGNSAAAGGGLAVSGDFVYVADTGNDRIQRFTLDGGHGAEIVPPGQLANPRGIAVRAHPAVRGRRPAPSPRRLRHRRAPPARRRPGRLGPGPAQLPLRRGHRRRRGASSSPTTSTTASCASAAGRCTPTRGAGAPTGPPPGRLAYPRGIAVDPQGNVYVANTGNDRIDVFDKGGTLLRSFGASGRALGQFDAPVGVAADAGGVRAVTDSVNGRLELLNPDGSPASSWGSPAPGPTILPNPVAVAFDAAGNAYVLDRRRSRIVVFARATGLPVRTIGSPGSGPGQLQNPSALTIDGGGTIVVADSGNERIARFGTGGSYLGATTGVGDGRGIAVTPDGPRTYVSTANHRIEVFDPSGSEVDEFGGQGSKLGKLESPGQITLDAAGNLWVADRGNNRIQEFGPAGERLLAFGQRGAGLGEFVHPTGVSVDCQGLLTRDRQRQQPRAAVRPGRAGDRAVRRARSRSATRRRPSSRRCPRRWARR